MNRIESRRHTHPNMRPVSGDQIYRALFHHKPSAMRENNSSEHLSGESFPRCLSVCLSLQTEITN